MWLSLSIGCYHEIMCLFLLFTWLQWKVQSLKYLFVFVGISRRYFLAVCPSVLLSLTSFCLYPHCDEWMMKSTAYAALLMNYWTVESGCDGVLHAMHTEEPLCERMTDVKKKRARVYRLLYVNAQTLTCMLNLLTFRNVCKCTLPAAVCCK